MTFTLGQAVRFTGVAEKVRSEGKTFFKSGALPLIHDSWGSSREVAEGVIVGVRTLTTTHHHTETEYGEYGYSYGTYRVISTEAGSGRKAWLVSYSLQRKPILVFDDQLSPIEEEPKGLLDV